MNDTMNQVGKVRNDLAEKAAVPIAQISGEVTAEYTYAKQDGTAETRTEIFFISSATKHKYDYETLFLYFLDMKNYQAEYFGKNSINADNRTYFHKHFDDELMICEKNGFDIVGELSNIGFKVKELDEEV